MEVIMSVGYEHIFRFPPYTENTESWRAITGDWPDDPWFSHDPRRTPWRKRLARRAGTRHHAVSTAAVDSGAERGTGGRS
jgi:hypothetical protein